MKHKAISTAILISLALATGGAWAEDAEKDIVDYVIEACAAEIKGYCGLVTPGEGRLLACFYAHGDKLTGRCEYALYNAAGQLEQFATALTHLATACLDDLEKHCAEVELGEGRVASCLLEHKEEVTGACRKAIDATELEVTEE